MLFQERRHCVDAAGSCRGGSVRDDQDRSRESQRRRCDPCLRGVLRNPGENPFHTIDGGDTDEYQGDERSVHVANVRHGKRGKAQGQQSPSPG